MCRVGHHLSNLGILNRWDSLSSSFGVSPHNGLMAVACSQRSRTYLHVSRNGVDPGDIVVRDYASSTTTHSFDVATMTSSAILCRSDSSQPR
ncbi:hypothetical protein SISSUDRAFT_433897 [Sistotremastrum suecicum HHB10207 ss-3]|uniref:Uncharacterized protein n=1 Tax=Sistotremastrum suecicum HHB10207 ss-3 TaxID=1314776 RepID=A0A165YG99_9AGAM|nr:hypothetical protein SISSUDRAFT_433897 [Sistotremastrum suecicum HHB10207 ss-3]